MREVMAHRHSGHTRTCLSLSVPYRADAATASDTSPLASAAAAAAASPKLCRRRRLRLAATALKPKPPRRLQVHASARGDGAPALRAYGHLPLARARQIDSVARHRHAF